MKTSTGVWAVILILVLGGGWYWTQKTSDSQGDDTVAPSATTGVQGSDDKTNTGPLVVPVVTVARDATLGNYLVASNGMTLYRYTKDTVGVSNCAGTCAVNWPPYTRAGSEPLLAGAGITGPLATISRADGSKQVTYKGVPLYFWKNDVKPGDTTGQNVGGVWFVLNP